MNLTLKQLRELQKANPPTLTEDGRIMLDKQRDDIIAMTGGAVRPAPISPPGAPTTEGSLPFQASPTAAPGGGYLRIFPPTVPTAAALSDEWKAANWGSAPSPWQHVEGQPMHPEFELNLKGAE